MRYLAGVKIATVRKLFLLQSSAFAFWSYLVRWMAIVPCGAGQVLLATYPYRLHPHNSYISHTELDDIALACLSYLISWESYLLIAYVNGKYDSSSKFQLHQHFFQHTLCVTVSWLPSHVSPASMYLHYRIPIATKLNYHGNLESDRGPDLVRDSPETRIGHCQLHKCFADILSAESTKRTCLNLRDWLWQ